MAEKPVLQAAEKKIGGEQSRVKREEEGGREWEEDSTNTGWGPGIPNGTPMT